MHERDLSAAVDAWGLERNPARRWWQFWRPRWIEMSAAEMRKFVGGTA